MLSSLSLYRHFDRRIRSGRRSRLPEPIRSLAERVDSGQAGGFLVRPTPTFYWIPFVISAGMLALLATLFVPMVAGGWRIVVRDGLSWEEAVTAVAVLLVLSLPTYYALWINLLGPRHLARHRDRYYVHLGDDGILRRDGSRYTFVPWTIVTGASLALGTTYMDDHPEGQRSLELQIDGRVVFTPYLVKGYGPGILFQDWVEYSRADLQELARRIHDRRR